MTTDDTPTSSGSRWEPTSEPAAEPTDPVATAPEPLETEAGPPSADAGPSRRRRWSLAAAGAGLVCLGGLVGFALGHATLGDGADDVPEGRFGRHGTPPDLDDRSGQPPGGDHGFRGDDHDTRPDQRPDGGLDQGRNDGSDT